MSGHEPSSYVLASLGIGSTNSGSEAVRPAPKTLMDLIKEDSPPPYSQGDPFSGYNNNHSIDRLAPPPRSQTAGAIYERTDFSYNERGTATSPLGTFSDDHYEKHRMDGYQQHQHQADPRGYTSSGSKGHGMDGVTQEMERLQVRPGGQQYVAGLPHLRVSATVICARFMLQMLTTPFSFFQVERASATQYVSVPMPMGNSTMDQHQESLFHEQARPQPRAIYSQPHPSQHPAPSRQFEGQQVYYAPSQTLPSHVVDQPPAFTTAVLPNGQTVYLNASQFSYSAAQPVQYQTPLHQSHMIHQQHQGQGQDYMTVLPMQSAGHIAYYQGVEGPVRGPQVIMNQPIAYPRGGVESAPVQSRGKEGDRGGKGAATKGRRGGAGAGPSSGRRDDPRAKHSATSPLLDEFRTTKNRDWTMLDITGHVVEFCQDQNGSRFIQQRLEIGNASEQKVVMAEVLPAVRQLRNDVFGNYVVQKLLEFGTEMMKAQLRDTLKGEMLPLSLQMYGCRVVQKALETLEEDDLPKLLIEFHHNVLSCIHDQNGNHVIQKCIEVMSTKAKQAYAVHDGERANFFGEQLDFIISDVLANVTSLSCHPYGCRVLQRILEHCIEPTKILALDEIAKCHKIVLDDQYGNYVIQHVLQYGRHQDRESIMHIVIANGLLPLSKQKFASNVVEKLLKYGTAAQRNLLVREMLVVVDDPNSGGSSVVLLMVRDAYANYVVQTTLDVVAEGEEKRLLLEELNAHSAQLVSRVHTTMDAFCLGIAPHPLTESFVLLLVSKAPIYIC